MPDIHGRHADTHHTLTPTQNPFLSLRLAG